MALPPIFIAFLGDYTGLKESADGVKKELAEVDAEGGASLKSLGAVGKGVMLGMGAAMVGAGYESVKLAMSFQTAMTQISTQAGVPKAQLSSLGAGVLQLAGQVGFSPDSLAEALYHIESSFASVGIKGPQALNILKVAAQGAAVGHANLVDVQNALDAAIASGIPGVQNYSQAMGALNAVIGSGDMQMQDLADALGTGVLAVVKGYGLTLNDVGAALATFGDNNIRGADAATDLRMAVQALSVPAKTAGADLKKMGMTEQTLADDMKKGGLSAALNDLSKRMHKAGLDGKNMGETITTMFGKKAGSGLAVLMDQIDRFNSKYPELEKGAGGFANAVTSNNETVSQQINMIKASFEAMGTSLGQKLLPTVTKVMGYLQKGITWLAAHPATFYAIAAAVGALTVSLGAISVVLAIVNSELLANPAVWIAVGVMALGAAVYYAYTHFKTFRDIVNDVGRFLKNVFGGAIDYIKAHLPQIEDALKRVGSVLLGAWNQAWKFAASVVTWFINNPIKFVKQELQIFAKFWRQHGQDLEQIAKSVWKIIGALIQFQIKFIVNFVKFSLAVLEAVWKIVWGVLRDSVKTVWHLISNIVRTGVNVILDIVGLFLDLLHGRWSKLGPDLWKLAKDAFGGLTKIFTQFASDAVKLLWDAGVNIIKGLVNGIKSGFGSIKNVMKDAGSLLSSAFHSFMGIFSPSRVMYKSGTYVIAGLVNSLKDGLPALGAVAGRLGAAIMTGFGSPTLGIGGMGTSVGNQLGMAGISGVNAGGTAVNVQMNIQGSVRTDKDLRDVIQTEFLQLGGRNMATWAPAKI
jgi:TP901 family phage tail tape measure protein